MWGAQMNEKGMIMNTKLATLFSIVCVVVFTALPARAESPNDILIVANNSVNLDTISLDEVRAIFLKKRKSWRGGGKVVPINAKMGTSLRSDFAQKVLGMSPSSEKRFWEEQKVKRGRTAPPELKTPLKGVFSLKGSVSYVRRKNFKPGVAKILLVIPSR